MHVVRTILGLVVIGIFLVANASNAEARHHHHHYRHYHAHRSVPVHCTIHIAGAIGGRPSGCPHAFCGCEASRYVFGKIIPELNLAYNWIRKFPRTMAAPGMAAARNHHVMVLISQVSGSDWLVHDGNGGHHMVWEHVRSISGYVIVNPHGGRFASL